MATLQLTTLADVKTLMGQDAPGATLDSVLTTMVQAVSAAVEKSLNRLLLKTARTEKYSPKPYATTVRLRALPVDASPFEFKEAPDRDFAAATAVLAEDFYLDLEAGVVHLDIELTGGPGTVQVISTGGLAADTATLKASYPDIWQAATFWVKELYENRNQLGRSGQSVAGGSVSWQDGLGEIPDVVEALIAPYRRPAF